MNFYTNEPLEEEEENLFEDWLKSSHESPSKMTVEINSVTQSYQEMFKNLEIIEVKDSSESLQSNEFVKRGLAFCSPREKSVSLMNFRDLNRTCYDSVVEQAQEPEELTKIFCAGCKRYSYPVINLRIKDFGLWGNIKFFFKSFKCCSSVGELKEYHEYAYICSYCRNVVAYKPVEAK